MTSSISVYKKKRGRPATGSGPAVTSRLTDQIVAALDGYITRQPEPHPSRSEMIRKILEDRLVHEGLMEPGAHVGTLGERSPKVCPECQHAFQGSGWDGIDAHWKAKHETIMPYAEAWPLIRAGKYKPR